MRDFADRRAVDFGQRGRPQAAACFATPLEGTAMDLETVLPALVVILLLAAFVVAFVWRLYVGPGKGREPSGADEQSGVLPD
jgi:hypothetical protein